VTVMLWVVAVMAIFNVLMVVLTLGLKLARDVNRRSLEAKSVRFEAALNDLILTGDTDPILLHPNRRDMDLLATKMIEYLSLLRGEQRERLTVLADRAGLVQKFFWRLGSRNRWRKAQAAESLGYFGGPEAARPVASLLSYQDETGRAGAARALARIGTPEAAEDLARTLNDPSELTRLRMAENLERLGAVATEPLIETLQTGNPKARVLAARVLGNLRTAEARPALRETLAGAREDDVPVDLVARATLALGRIGDPDDVPEILAASESEHWPVRAQAANALEAIGDVVAIPALRRLTVDEEWWVRLNASRALSRMGPAGERALVEVLEGEDRFARDRAAGSLESRGITRRAAGALARPDGNGAYARRLIRAMTRAGSTRYLHRLSETMPDDDNRRELVRILESGGEPPAADRPETEEDRIAAEPPTSEPAPTQSEGGSGREIVPLEAVDPPARRSAPSSFVDLVRRHPIAGVVAGAGVAAVVVAGIIIGGRGLGRVLRRGGTSRRGRRPARASGGRRVGLLRGWRP
jgi:HEAT repeat protein